MIRTYRDPKGYSYFVVLDSWGNITFQSSSYLRVSDDTGWRYVSR